MLTITGKHIATALLRCPQMRKNLLQKEGVLQPETGYKLVGLDDEKLSRRLPRVL